MTRIAVAVFALQIVTFFGLRAWFAYSMASAEAEPASRDITGSSDEALPSLSGLDAVEASIVHESRDAETNETTFVAFVSNALARFEAWPRHSSFPLGIELLAFLASLGVAGLAASVLIVRSLTTTTHDLHSGLEKLEHFCDRAGFQTDRVPVPAHVDLVELEPLNRSVHRMLARRALLENQLRQAQKLEAVGHLAGGIAHDFNNLLAAISGNAEVLALELAGDSEARESARVITRAARRASDLTRQLLTYSRQSHRQRVDVDLHEVIRETVTLLRHSIDPRIRVVTDLRAELTTILGDPCALQTALLNLCVNARDAMSGQLADEAHACILELSTRRVRHDPLHAVSLTDTLPAGDYIELKVTDTGPGVPADVREHMFEPFFTTKGPQQGTGLGLANVHGCVEAHRGRVAVDSELGRGACFTVVLPLAERREPAARSRDPQPIRKGHGRILVVDDEELVRDCSARALARLGYEVLQSADGIDAIEQFRVDHEDLDLVLLDLTMPNMDGETSFEQFRTIDSGVPILICTGYGQNDVVSRLLEAGAAGFVQKPFRIGELSHLIAEALERRSARARPSDPTSDDGGSPRIVEPGGSMTNRSRICTRTDTR